MVFQLDGKMSNILIGEDEEGRKKYSILGEHRMHEGDVLGNKNTEVDYGQTTESLSD